MMDELHPTIAVDFDKTICDDSIPFPGFGLPIDGAKEALSRLRELGYRIKIYTCRLNGQAVVKGSFMVQYNNIIEWLQFNHIPYDDVATPEEGKIFAEFYIDDKGVRFENNWDNVVSFIEKEADIERHKNNRISWHRQVDEIYIDKKLAMVIDKEIFEEIKKIKNK